MADNAEDAKRYAPAAARNRVPIRDVLARVLPARGLVLEIASGTGEHAAFLAAAFPALDWQPSDPDAANRASIAAWRAQAGAANLRAPLDIDASAPDWGLAAADAVLCINMIHIAPWSAAEGLVRGAARLLPPGGLLYLYGPFMEGGRHTAESNAAFDADLRARNPAWGVRDADDVAALAARHGLALAETVVMPANNRSLVFRRV
jgi:SAM-dependent methyltransferase